MEQGFASLITASASLLGLVLVALVFALSSGMTRLEDTSEFRHFARWMWMAGMGCFLYFSCIILLAFRLRENETGAAVLIAVTAIITAALVVSHALEFYFMWRMAGADRRGFRLLFLSQALFDAVVFLVFAVLAWTALSRSDIHVMKQDLYTALTYTVFFASLRSVVLVGSSFWAITLLSHSHAREDADSG